MDCWRQWAVRGVCPLWPSAQVCAPVPGRSPLLPDVATSVCFPSYNSPAGIMHARLSSARLISYKKQQSLTAFEGVHVYQRPGLMFIAAHRVVPGHLVHSRFKGGLKRKIHAVCRLLGNLNQNLRPFQYMCCWVFAPPLLSTQLYA